MSADKKERDILYRKVGARYIPVREYDPAITDSVPIGSTTLIVSDRNTTMRRYNIKPDLASLVAAACIIQDRLSSIIIKSSQGKPNRAPLTPEQIEAWDNMKEVFGDELFSIVYPSACDVAENVMKEIVALVEKKMTHPSVREAWEHLKLMMTLCEES